MSMTPAQKKTYEQVCSEQVAWPPSFEADNGAVVVVLAVSFGFVPGASWESQTYFPNDFELEAVRIEADGTHKTLGVSTFMRRRR